MKKYLFLMIAAVLAGCSSQNYDGLVVSNMSFTGCNQATRSEGDVNHSTIKLTRDGILIHVVLNNYKVNCDYGDLIVKCNQQGHLSIAVNELNSRKDIVKSTCICPVNIYFSIENTKGESFHVYLDNQDLGEVSFKDHSVVEIDLLTHEQAYEEGFDYRERLSEVVTTPIQYLPEEMPWDKPRLELSYNAELHTIHGIYWYYLMPCDYTKFDMVMDTETDGTLVFKFDTNGDYSSTCESYSQIIFKMLNAQKDEYRVKINPHKVFTKNSNGSEDDAVVYDYEGIIQKDDHKSILLKLTTTVSAVPAAPARCR